MIKQNINPKGTTHQLMKEFTAILYSEGEMLDGTYFHRPNKVFKFKEDKILGSLYDDIDLKLPSRAVLQIINNVSEKTY